MNHVHRRNGKVENNFYGWPDAGEAAGFPAMTRDLELPKTIGEETRKRRLDRGIRQIDMAKIIGCDDMSVVNWEKSHTPPRINHMGEVVNSWAIIRLKEVPLRRNDW